MYMVFSACLRARDSGETQTLSEAVVSRQTYGYAHCSQPYSSIQHKGLAPHLRAGAVHSDVHARPLQLAVSLSSAGLHTSST